MAVQKNAKGLYEAVIDGVTYEFSPWGVRQALDGLVDLSSIAGEFLAKAAGLFSKPGAMTSDVNSDALGGVVAALVQGMTKDKANTLNFVERLATQGVSREGRDVDYTKDFDANLMHLLQVVRAALEVQYGSFFGGARGMLTPKTAPSS